MIGDIILQKRSGTLGKIVSFFTRSEYVHCGIELADDVVVHVYPWKGQLFTPIAEWEAESEITRLTPIIPLTDLQLNNLRWVIGAMVVRGYDWWSAVRSWFWKSTNDQKYTGKYYTCSEYVSCIYREGVGIDLVPNCSDDSTQPHMFVDSSYLKEVE